MSSGRTIAQLTHEATTALGSISDDARLEVEVLFAHAIGSNRAHLLAQLHEEVDSEVGVRFEAALARRINREPLAYIIGRREFYGIDFAVTPDVLVPRPETEMLVEFALDEVWRRGSGTLVADVGTGSGTISIAVAINAPDARVIATDASDGALSVARANAIAMDVDTRIDFRLADLVEGVPEVDVMLANLPYVSEADWATLEPEVRDFEPRTALVGGVIGSETIERLLELAPRHLRGGGAMAMEMGATQAERLVSVAGRCFPEAEVSVMKDFGGLDRMLVVRLVGG